MPQLNSKSGYIMFMKLEMEYKWVLDLIGRTPHPSHSEFPAKNYMQAFCDESVNYLQTFRHLNGKHPKSLELDYGILEFLAIEGPETPYRISADLNVRGSSVNNSISRLKDQGLIRVENTDKWRTGLYRKQYELTTIGLTALLAYHPRKKLLPGQHIESGDGLPFKLTFDCIKRYPQIHKWLKENIDNKMLDKIIKKNIHLPIFDIIFSKWREMEKSNMLEGDPLQIKALAGYAYQNCVIFNRLFYERLFQKTIIKQLRYLFFDIFKDRARTPEDLKEKFQSTQTRIYGSLAILLLQHFLTLPFSTYDGTIWAFDDANHIPYVQTILKNLYDPFTRWIEEEIQKTQIKLEFLHNLSQSTEKIMLRKM